LDLAVHGTDATRNRKNVQEQRGEYEHVSRNQKPGRGQLLLWRKLIERDEFGLLFLPRCLRLALRGTTLRTSRRDKSNE
jgi:hypothetical protein